MKSRLLKVVYHHIHLLIFNVVLTDGFSDLYTPEGILERLKFLRTSYDMGWIDSHIVHGEATVALYDAWGFLSYCLGWGFPDVKDKIQALIEETEKFQANYGGKE